MASPTRATVYLNAKVYRAAKVKAAASDRSFSEVVNAALLLMLKEDALDTEAFDSRRSEPSRPFESVLKALKRDGLL
jgi:hypothetical protein